MRVVMLKETGENIKRMMDARGYNARQVGMMLGLTAPTAVYHWAAGVCLPRIDNLIALADFFECKIDDILITEEV